MTDGLITAADVERAAELLRDVVRHTPLQRCERLSALTGARVWLKREDLQSVRSYKIRGAFTLMSSLTEAERAAGVVTASAGNHAQGVASACRVLDVKGRIFVPGTTPRQKRDRIRALGGDHVELIMAGESFDECAAVARANAEETGAVMVPAFDDDRIIAGQGTVLLEIVDDLVGVPDALVVPVGGGGLISGMAAWLATCETTGADAVRLIGAEPEGAASLAAALDAGRPVPLADLDTFVDGASVGVIGTRTFAHVRGFKRLETCQVSTGAVCTQMLELYQVEGIIAEPAGALAAAALAEGGLTFEPDTDVVVIVSGGNNDISRYSEVVERSLVHVGLKHYFIVNFPQEPGALRRFLDDVLGPDDDIALFEYVKRSNRDSGPALVGIELGRAEDLDPLLARMDAANLVIERIDPESSTYRLLT
ncbi:threonine ammonia-lyase IlvA [Micrococcales bacterium 31B]|nr:threonine ammonia-lyase IlvA [Micrococcales bacterium 31B]